MFRTFDDWKCDCGYPDDDEGPMCSACDDYGCPECCPTEPLTDDDLDEMFLSIEAHEGWLK